MAELRIVTLAGADSALDEAVVEQFGSRLRGGLLRPATPNTKRLDSSGTA